jgi:hypothetical protein
MSTVLSSFAIYIYNFNTIINEDPVVWCNTIYKEQGVRARATSDGMRTEPIFRSFGRSHKHGRAHFVERCAERWSRSDFCLALCKADLLVTVRGTPTDYCCLLPSLVMRDHVPSVVRVLLWPVQLIASREFTRRIFHVINNIAAKIEQRYLWQCCFL